MVIHRLTFNLMMVAYMLGLGIGWALDTTAGVVAALVTAVCVTIVFNLYPRIPR